MKATVSTKKMSMDEMMNVNGGQYGDMMRDFADNLGKIGEKVVDFLKKHVIPLQPIKFGA